MPKAKRTQAEYEAQVHAHGKVTVDDTYIDIGTPIYHICNEHGERHLAKPRTVGRGQGLKCCAIAATKERQKKRRQKFIDEFDQRIEDNNPNLIRIGKLVDGDTPVEFYCVRHQEIHKRNPRAAVKSGAGLKCCRQARMRLIGKQYGSVFLTSVDTVWRALTGQLDNKGPAKLYLYSTPEPGYNKFGVSKNPKQHRESVPIYNKQLLKPHLHFLYREDAVLIEQAYKYGYACETPESLAGMEGCTEVTTATLEEFEETIAELMAALKELGRWGFAEEYCDPQEVAIAYEKRA